MQQGSSTMWQGSKKTDTRGILVRPCESIGDDLPQGALVQFLNTRRVAELLGTSPDTLGRAVWAGRVPAPMKSPSGSFLWTLMDARRASWALFGRDLPSETPLDDPGAAA